MNQLHTCRSPWQPPITNGSRGAVRGHQKDGAKNLEDGETGLSGQHGLLVVAGVGVVAVVVEPLFQQTHRLFGQVAAAPLVLDAAGTAAAGTAAAGAGRATGAMQQPARRPRPGQARAAKQNGKSKMNHRDPISCSDSVARIGC